MSTLAMRHIGYWIPREESPLDKLEMCGFEDFADIQVDGIYAMVMCPKCRREIYAVKTTDGWRLSDNDEGVLYAKVSN